jgi:hypothetical protein
LPSISARIEGSLAVHSNLDVFGAKLRQFIATIPTKPTTDQEFADCDAACKALKKAEEALDGAEANALGQVQTVETLTRTIADLRTVARTARLASEKVVKARKDQIRIEEVPARQARARRPRRTAQRAVGRPLHAGHPADFGAAISGLKSLDSRARPVDQLLADKKIEANDIAGASRSTCARSRRTATTTSCSRTCARSSPRRPEDFQAIVQNRVRRTRPKKSAAEEAARERIRQEEARQAAARTASRAAARGRCSAGARRERRAGERGRPVGPSSARGKPTLAPGRGQRANRAAGDHRGRPAETRLPCSRARAQRLPVPRGRLPRDGRLDGGAAAHGAGAPARSGGRMKPLMPYDTETTGLPLFEQPSDHPDQPHIVQLAAL